MSNITNLLKLMIFLFLVQLFRCRKQTLSVETIKEPTYLKDAQECDNICGGNCGALVIDDLFTDHVLNKLEELARNSLDLMKVCSSSLFQKHSFK